MNANVQPIIFEDHNALPLVSGFSARIQCVENLGSNRVYHLQGKQNHLLAYAAESLLVSPEEGDLVICVMAEDHLFITQVLQRYQPTESLRIISSRPVDWVAPSLRFKALQDMELLSLNRLTVAAEDIISHATRTLVQQAHTVLQKVKTFS